MVVKGRREGFDTEVRREARGERPPLCEVVVGDEGHRQGNGREGYRKENVDVIETGRLTLNTGASAGVVGICGREEGYERFPDGGVKVNSPASDVSAPTRFQGCESNSVPSWSRELSTVSSPAPSTAK